MDRNRLHRGIPKDISSFGNFVFGSLLDKRPINGKDAGVFIYTERGEIEVIPETVGDFIGILDKNNNMIFEGDKVFREPVSKYAGGSGEFLIKWNDGYAMFGLYWEGSEFFPTDSHNRFYKIIPKKIEIIGNEHSHLLESFSK